MCRLMENSSDPARFYLEEIYRVWYIWCIISTFVNPTVHLYTAQKQKVNKEPSFWKKKKKSTLDTNIQLN
jgi:hypothetical protein